MTHLLIEISKDAIAYLRLPLLITVCKTSPISNLIQIAAFPLLGRLFTQLTIPPEVAEELDAETEVYCYGNTST